MAAALVTVVFCPTQKYHVDSEMGPTLSGVSVAILRLFYG